MYFSQKKGETVKKRFETVAKTNFNIAPAMNTSV